MADPFFASPDQRFAADLSDLVQGGRGLPSLHEVMGGAAAAPAGPDYETVSSRYDVPINVLMAVGESGGDVERAARTVRTMLGRGLGAEDAIVSGLAGGNADAGRRLLDRAYQIADEQFPEPRAVETAPLGAADAPQTEWKPIGTGEPAPAAEGNEDGNIFFDTLNLVRSGVNTAAEDVQELVRRTPIVGQAIADAASAADRWMMGKSTDEVFREQRQAVEAGWSPEMQAARRKDWVAEGPDGYSFGPAWSDPRAYYSGLVESLPEMVITMGPTGLLAKGAYVGAVARGAGKAAAARAAARTATIAGGLMEGGLGGAQSSRSVRDRISAMTPEQLASSEAMETLLRQGKSFEEARAALADEASTQAFILAGVTTGIFGGLGDRALAKIITGPAKGRLSAAVRGAVGEGLLEEAPQSGFQQVAENRAMQEADPGQRLMEGVANQAVGGAVVGGLMGAGLGAAAPHAGDAPDTRPAETEESLSAAAPDAPAAPAAMPAPAEAEPKGPMERALDHGIAEVDAAVRRTSALTGQRVTVTDEAGSHSGTVTDEGAYGLTFQTDDGQLFEYGRDDLDAGTVTLQAEGASPAPAADTPLPVGAVEPVPAAMIADTGPAAELPLPGAQDPAVPEESVATPAGAPGPAPAAASDNATAPNIGTAQTQPVEAPSPPPAAEPQPADSAPDTVTMSAADLRARLDYLGQQAMRSGGWDRRLTDERSRVEAALAALPTPQTLKDANGTAPDLGLADERMAGDRQPEAGAADQQVESPATAEGGEDGRDSPAEPLPGMRAALPDAGDAGIAGPALTTAQLWDATAPEQRIAAARAAGEDRWHAEDMARRPFGKLPPGAQARLGKAAPFLAAVARSKGQAASWDTAAAADRVAVAQAAGWDRRDAEDMARRPFGKLHPEARQKLERTIGASLAGSDRPLAAAGLTSYRYRGPNGWIMIGARDDADALREANRSLELPNAKRNELQVWDGEKYAAVEIAPAAGGATTDTAASQRSDVTSGPAGQSVTSKPKGKRKSPRKIVSEREAAISDYFTPGNIVSASTGGFDRVIAFGPAPDGYGNLVTVQAVRKDGNRWVDLRGEGVRRHGTMPSERALKAGPVERADSTATDISAKPTDSEPETRYSMAPGPKAPAGAFGPVFPGYTNKPEAAIRKLMDEKRGEVADAFVHPELGPIAFVYGNEKMGLRHIEAKRGPEFLDRIPKILRSGQIIADDQGLPRTYVVSDSDKVAVIRLDWDGEQKTWLVTAYTDDEGKFAGGGKTSNTPASRGQVPSKAGVVFSERPGVVDSTTTDSAGQSSKRQPEDTRYSVVPGSEADARRFLEGPPVASMKGDEVPALGKMANIADWVGDHYAGTVRGKVVHPEIGEIRLDRRSVKDTLSHGYGRDKVQALYLLPEALPKARILAEEARSDETIGYILGAPVEIGDRRLVAAMIVTRTENRVGLYVHEVVLLEKLRGAINTAAHTGLNETAELSRDDPGAIRNVLEKVFRGNDGQMSSGLGLSDRTGFSAAADARTHLLAGIYSSAIGGALDAGRIVIHDDATTLPGKEHPDGAIRGMTTADGTIHLVASNLTRANIEPVLLHEAFHSGVRPLIGDAAWNRVMERVSTATRLAMERAATGTTGPHDAFWTAALTNARVAGTPKAHLAEEVAAYAIEHSALAPNGVREMIDQLAGAVKAWLLRRFGIQAGAVTPRELRSLASAALRDWDANTVASPVSQDGARYSMASATPPAADKGSIPQRLYKSSPLFRKSVDAMSRALTSAMVGTKSDDGGRGRTAITTIAPTRPLFLELAQGMPSAKTYIDLKMSMDTMRNDWHALAADVVQRWTRLAKAANKDLMAIMHEATLAQVDPTARFDSFMTPGDWYGLQNNDPDSARYEDLLKKQAEDKERKAAHDDLVERFGKLPEEAQALFREVRDHYRRMADATQKQVLDNVEEALKAIDKKAERTYDDELKRIADEGLTGKERDAAIEDAERRRTFTKSRTKRNKAARLRKLRNDFESNRLRGAYFPLARFGHYFATLRDADGKVVSFSRFESLKKRDAFIADIERTEPDLTVERGVLTAKPGDTGAVDAKFMADLDAILDGAGAPEALRDAFWQRYLETLPDMSTRKNRIHRKGTAGFDTDAIRAFAHNVFHGSHQLARLTYGIRMQTAVDEIVKQSQTAPDPDRAKAVANEILRRHDFIMNPSVAPWSHLLTSFAFIWTMGANLSSALVNIDQTFTKALPWIAVDREIKPGARKAISEFMRATRDFTMGGGWAEKGSKLTADEKAAMRAGYENGLIDRTQAHDVAGVAETGVAYSDRRDRFMKFLSWPMHQTERFNREVTFLASYRMAREKGMEHGEAIRKASDLTWMSHFDNQSTSKPRFMQSDIGRVMFAMKSFQVNLLYRIFRDLHQAMWGEAKEVRNEAIGRLVGAFVATSLATGVSGTMGIGTIFMIASLFMSDEDDPEQKLRKWVLEHTGDTIIGRAVGGMMMDGIPGYLTGTALSGRIGMSDLWFRSNDRDLEGADAFVNLAGQVLGAPFGIGYSVFRGGEDVLKGNVWRGAEGMSPAAVRNIMKSSRYGWEGALNRKGAAIVENVPVADIIKQAIGFTPAQIAEQNAQTTAAYNMQQRVRDEKAGLVDALWRFRDDPARRAEAIDRVKAFNRKHPTAPITPDSINQSMRGRERYLKNAVGGANIDKRLRPEIEQKLPPSVY